MGKWHIRARRADGVGGFISYMVPDSLGELDSHIWSPDGKWLTMQTRKDGLRHLHAVNVGTDSIISIAATPGVK
jgi:Tol biopolymer transport system component